MGTIVLDWTETVEVILRGINKNNPSIILFMTEFAVWTLVAAEPVDPLNASRLFF